MGFTFEIIRANRYAIDDNKSHKILMESNASFYRGKSHEILDNLFSNSFSSFYENRPSHELLKTLLIDHPELSEYADNFWFIFELLNHEDTDDTIVFLRSY
jgi:hypothetical protein